MKRVRQARYNDGIELTKALLSLCQHRGFQPIAHAPLRAGGLKLQFDDQTETFVDAPEANKYLKRTGRALRIIPEQV